MMEMGKRYGHHITKHCPCIRSNPKDAETTGEQLEFKPHNDTEPTELYIDRIEKEDRDPAAEAESPASEDLAPAVSMQVRDAADSMNRRQTSSLHLSEVSTNE